MANLPISGLTASAANLAATDVLPVVQTTGVGPVKMTGLQLAGGLLGSATFNAATVTTSQPVLNLSQTWNAGAVTFTGLKFNATDTASASGSLLLDIGTGGGTYSSKFNVDKNGTVTLPNGTFTSNVGGAGLLLSVDSSGLVYFRNSASRGIEIGSINCYSWSSGSPALNPTDLFLTRAAAATLQLGAADAAAPVAQTLQVQSVVAGTSNTAGTNWTLKGSAGTGTGAGGSIIFQVAPAGSSGTAQNAYATAFSIISPASTPLLRWATSNAYFKNSDVNTFIIGDLNAGSSSSNYGIAVRPLSSDTGIWINGGIGIGANLNSQDVYILRDAANTLALRNSTNAQTFNLYETYTDSSNYSRVSLTQSSIYFFLQTQAAGTGTKRGLILRGNGTNSASLALVGDALSFGTSAADYWTMSSSGHFLAGADNTYDIGASGTTNRVRTFYSGGGYSAAGPSIKTADYSQGIHDYSLIFNGSGSITLTLLAAATYPGKVLYVKTIAAQTVVSASSNVKPIDSDTAGTAILAATAGKWAMLQSDGTNWVVMAQG